MARVAVVGCGLWGKNLLDDDTPLDVLRYIDRRSGTLPRCGTALTPTDPNTVCRW